jgi:hypothetical protein
MNNNAYAGAAERVRRGGGEGREGGGPGGGQGQQRACSLLQRKGGSEGAAGGHPRPQTTPPPTNVQTPQLWGGSGVVEDQAKLVLARELLRQLAAGERPGLTFAQAGMPVAAALGEAWGSARSRAAAVRGRVGGVWRAFEGLLQGVGAGAVACAVAPPPSTPPPLTASRPR